MLGMNYQNTILYLLVMFAYVLWGTSCDMKIVILLYCFVLFFCVDCVCMYVCMQHFVIYITFFQRYL